MQRNKRRYTIDEDVEDTTLYGEFISSFDQWMTLDKQKERADTLVELSEEKSTNFEKK